MKCGDERTQVELTKSMQKSDLVPQVRFLLGIFGHFGMRSCGFCLCRCFTGMQLNNQKGTPQKKDIHEVWTTRRRGAGAGMTPKRTRSLDPLLVMLSKPKAAQRWATRCRNRTSYV